MTTNSSWTDPAIDILVVDDEIGSRRLLTEILAKEGYRVRPADGPQVALESARAHPPGLILLDVRMPVMSGFEVCRRLKQDERTRDIPIIFVSALHEMEDRVQGFEIGGVDFISKPIEEAEVLARVNTHLQLRDIQLNLMQLVSERTAELKESNIALSESESKYRTVVEEAREGILIMQDGQRKYYNPRWLEMTGYSAEEYETVPFLSQVHSDDLETVEKEYLNLQTGQISGVLPDYRIITKSGEIIWMSTRGSRIQWEDKPAVMFFIEDITERKQVEQSILEYQERLKALTSQLAIVEERERQRIAVELHDNVGQSLAYARIQLAAACELSSKDERNTTLEEISQTLLVTIKETRSLVFDLSSPLLGEIGLGAAISEYLETQVEQRYGLRTEFIEHALQVPLSEDVSVILFRNVRELLNNVLRHASASQVSVHLDQDKEWTRISIVDDGIGFDPDQLSNKTNREGVFGLFSIQERMSDLGGSLKITSKPGQGCHTVLLAPIRVNSNSEKGS
jgi:PAS domain S-box-containing protein